MHDDRIMTRLRATVGHVVLLVALAVVPVVAFNSLATAASASDGGSGPTGARPGLTDSQRQCLADQGVTVPSGSSNDAKPPLTREQRQELRAAGQACGVGGTRARAFAGGLARGLTDEQRQCLADQGVSLPARSTDGSRPTVSAAQRDALRQAAESCGLPARGHHGGVPARSDPAQSEPGCGSPTSNHQRASSSISVTAARSSSLNAPGWRATRITVSDR